MLARLLPEPVADCVDWTAIRSADRSIVIEGRNVDELMPIAGALAAQSLSIKAQGSAAELALQLAPLPALLANDILLLAHLYCALMQASACRLRLEAVDRQPCWKWHADYTDIRLITTYVGAGTQYLPREDSAEADMRSVPTGAVALFKGRCFGDDHPACIHRSPPFGAGDTTRLVLVIDTVRHEH